MAYIKVCKNCGEENEANAEYCKKCDTHILDRNNFQFKEIKEESKIKYYRRCQICRNKKLQKRRWNISRKM